MYSPGYLDLVATFRCPTRQVTIGNKKAPRTPQASPRSLARREIEERDVLVQRTVKRNIRHAHDKREALYNAKMQRFVEDTDNAGFLTGLDDVLRHAEKRRRYKKKEMCNVWHSNVYSKIQSSLEDQLKQVDRVKLQERLWEHQRRYVEETKKSPFGNIFMHTPDTLAYNSAIKGPSIKVVTRRRSLWHPEGIVDPLHEQEEKVMERYAYSLSHQVLGGTPPLQRKRSSRTQ